MNLVQKAVQHGGKLAPLVIPTESKTGLMNPSVFVDNDGDILVNLRHVNYSLYHSENQQLFPSRWGPLSYLHPENDQALRTINYLVRLDKDLKVTDYTQVEMLSLHTPCWEFTGLEDARLVQWDETYYIIGVRRDTKTNGEGRMEYSAIVLDKDEFTATEVHRVRIPDPGNDDTAYCNKNWVPVLDKPYHFIKWHSPTELVYADPTTPMCETVAHRETLTPPRDLRGSSQLVRWGNMYVSISHEVDLFKNYLKQKDAIYRHRLCVWDDQLNLVGISKEFSFLDFRIEFCAGADVLDGNLLISFGACDNAAFVLSVPGNVVEDLILEALTYEF